MPDAASHRPRRVIVIGGSSGIGAAIAARCRAEGHRVVCAQRRAGATDTVRLDLREPFASINGALEAAVRMLGGLDWLVVSGGTAGYQESAHGAALKQARAEERRTGDRPLDRYLEVAEETMRTSAIGPILALEAAFRFLERPPHDPEPSRALLIGSTITQAPPPDLAWYAAAKAAAQVAYLGLARRMARHGVRVNVLATGWARTPMTEAIAPAKLTKILRAVALGRMAEPEEIADAAYAVLAGSAYFAGDTIEVSGGLP